MTEALIMHSAGDVEDYPLMSHAPSVSVHFCQDDNVNKPFSLWKHKSKFNEPLRPGAIKAKKIGDTAYLVAFACINRDGTINEALALNGLPTIFKKAKELDAMVYFQYRGRFFPRAVRELIAATEGAVVCYLAKVDNGANQS